VSIKTAYLSFSQQPDDDDHFFSDIDNFGKTTVRDAFEDFLNSLPIFNVNDPISWWYGIGDPLAHMGLDFLSAPGRAYIHLFSMCLTVKSFQLCQLMSSAVSQEGDLL
jgi:hypothetical protein